MDLRNLQATFSFWKANKILSPTLWMTPHLSTQLQIELQNFSCIQAEAGCQGCILCATTPAVSTQMPTCKHAQDLYTCTYTYKFTV